MELIVEIKQQYGQQTVIPRNIAADIFCQIAGSKTLTPRIITAVKALGYKVTVLNTLPAEL